MSLPDRRRPSLQLTEDQVDRLDRYAQRTGQTKQALLLRALLRDLEEDGQKDQRNRDD